MVNYLRVLQHFLDRRVTIEDAANAILPKRHHPELDRLFFENHRRRALVDQRADRVSDPQQLVDSFPAFVTGVVASFAAFSVVEILVADFVRREPELREEVAAAQRRRRKDEPHGERVSSR